MQRKRAASALLRVSRALYLASVCLIGASKLLAADDAQVPPGAKMSYLDNGVVKVGVDLNHGGAIVFLSRNGGRNLINNFDLGRQVQLSFYSGPVPFTTADQKPAKHWEHIGWNPIQTGDDFRNPSRVLAYENNGRTLHIQCLPMQWPLNNVPGECSFDLWLELDGAVVKARARLNNARTDHTFYPARLQELPAVYANAPYHRVVSYLGERPFTDDAISDAPKPTGKHPWSFWIGTEGWSALLDESDHGVGLITPGRVHFTGGFAGKPGPNNTLGNSTGYLAGQAQEILDHNIVFEFRYELLAGSLQEIRARALAGRPPALPGWTFVSDRQGWHYRNATDQGWPIAGHLHVRLDLGDPQLISPHTFWQAQDAPFLVIEAAMKASRGDAMVSWQPLANGGAEKERILHFPIIADGEFHRTVVRLADHPGYRGALTRLRFDPSPGGEKDAWVKIKSIKLAREP